MNNRLIKFRVWHKELKRFLTPDEWYLNLNGELYFNELVGGGFGERAMVKCNPKYYEIIQYTGLQDDEGVDICEGDIVDIHIPQETSSRHQSEVKLCYTGVYVCAHPAHTSAGAAKFRHLSHYCKGYSETSFNEYASCKIIGNVFENPELLK